MNKLDEKKFFNIILTASIAIIIFIVTRNYLVIKNHEKGKSLSFKEKMTREDQGYGEKGSSYYNTPCPEIVLTTVNQKKIDIRELIGKVIIIKFSKFYKNDLPKLIYLEHIARKFKETGISLIFINSLGKYDKKSIERICNLSYPIVEDDGSIISLFNAEDEDIIIVDKNFHIKFKNHIFDKSIIYDEVKKWVFEGKEYSDNVNKKEISNKIKRLRFYDIIENKEKYLNKIILNKNVILTLFTSMCIDCNENFRIQLLKDISAKIIPEQNKILFLFGIGNNSDGIRQFAITNGWDKLPIIVGIVKEFDKSQEDDFLSLFQLDIDPRTFILNNNGEVIYAENIYNFRLIKFDSMTRK
jgi:hypothetical protein